MAKTYTYRKGKKVRLVKKSNMLVVRASPEDIKRMGFTGSMQQVSPNSTRLGVNREDLDSALDEIRKEAVAHHAYKREDNGSEFLITDRIMITFKEYPSNEVLSAFISKYVLILLTKYSNKEYLLRLTDQTGMNPLKLVVLINETEQNLIENCEHDLNLFNKTELKSFKTINKNPCKSPTTKKNSPLLLLKGEMAIKTTRRIL